MSSGVSWKSIGNLFSWICRHPVNEFECGCPVWVVIVHYLYDWLFSLAVVFISMVVCSVLLYLWMPVLCCLFFVCAVSVVVRSVLVFIIHDCPFSVVVVCCLHGCPFLVVLVSSLLITCYTVVTVRVHLHLHAATFHC